MDKTALTRKRAGKAENIAAECLRMVGDGKRHKSITLAFAMQARQQSWADATGEAPGVLEFTSRSTVLPCIASQPLAHLNDCFSS